MNKIKITKEKKGGSKPMAPFKTMDEEATFWDTHSAVDEINEGTLIGFHQTTKTDTLTVRFEPKDLQKIREKAMYMGVGPTTLVRMWVKDQLRHASK